MNKAIKHLRGNAIAYLALFVALGGTSYAAISVPRNSVGTRQLRDGAVTTSKLANGSITPTKLNSSMIGASVRAWALITPSGTVVASSEPTQTMNWNPGSGSGGRLTFAHPLTGNCFSMASPNDVHNAFGPSAGFANADLFETTPGQPGGAVVNTWAENGTPAALPVLVMVFCSP